MSTTSKPSRRVTALATLAFASAVTGGSASSSAAAAASPARSTPPTPRSTSRPATAQPARPAASVEARLELPADLDVAVLADALGVHPGRLMAALRRLAPDETRSIGGLDPLTALANELRLPPTDVYLAVARLVASSR